MNEVINGRVVNSPEEVLIYRAFEATAPEGYLVGYEGAGSILSITSVDLKGDVILVGMDGDALVWNNESGTYWRSFETVESPDAEELSHIARFAWTSIREELSKGSKSEIGV